MVDVKPGQIWRIDGRPACIMNVGGDEVEAWYRDMRTAPGDLSATVTLRASVMLADGDRFEFIREPHEAKSAGELEGMILSRIREQPVCPPGMGVVVRKNADGTWGADSVPPPGSNIAYADCANYIGRIVQDLRQRYDLA